MRLAAIDIHGHFGTYDYGEDVLANRLFSGNIELVRSRAKNAGVRLTVVSPLKSLMPSGGNTLAGNEETLRIIQSYQDIMFWAVLNPKIRDSYSQVKKMLSLPKCAGIKIHPVLHGYEIKDRGEEIFKFAADNRILVLTHSGDSGSLPEDFVSFANQYSEVNLILAHLGNSSDEKLSTQVLAIKETKNNNVYVDTSSSRSICSGLIEWAVKEIGEDRILFGSDTPLYSVASQKSRIEHAEVSEKAKQAILFKNAEKLLEINRKLVI